MSVECRPCDAYTRGLHLPRIFESVEEAKSKLLSEGAVARCKAQQELGV